MEHLVIFILFLHGDASPVEYTADVVEVATPSAWKAQGQENDFSNIKFSVT